MRKNIKIFDSIYNFSTVLQKGLKHLFICLYLGFFFFVGTCIYYAGDYIKAKTKIIELKPAFTVGKDKELLDFMDSLDLNVDKLAVKINKITSLEQKIADLSTAITELKDLTFSKAELLIQIDNLIKQKQIIENKISILDKIIFPPELAIFWSFLFYVSFFSIVGGTLYYFHSNLENKIISSSDRGLDNSNMNSDLLSQQLIDLSSQLSESVDKLQITNLKLISMEDKLEFLQSELVLSLVKNSTDSLNNSVYSVQAQQLIGNHLDNITVTADTLSLFT